MAQTLERNPLSSAEIDVQAVPPAVVCALNGSPPGRAAAAYAAALARALDLRLGLVASGLTPLEFPVLAQAVIDERAGVVVQPSEARGNAGEAGELARRTRVPVVVVPRHRRDRPPIHGSILAIAAPERSVTGPSTRLALALGRTLHVLHAESREDIARFVEQADPRTCGLVVVAAEHAPAIEYRKVSVPVMFVPAGSTGR